MADLTGKLIADSYKNLLQAPGPNNDGLASGQSITIQDGSGNNSGLALSQAGVALTGTINIQGSQFTGTGSQLNTAVANAGNFVVGVVAQNGAQSFGRTLTASTGVSISNANGTAGNPTFSLADSGVTSATYGPTTMLNIDSTGRVISTDTTAVISATTFESSNVNAQYGNFSTDVSVGGQLTVTGSFQPTNISTSIVSATNVVASVATINNLTVSGNVTATAYYGDGSNLTNIVAASATNASYAASAGEAAVAVSAHHATSANTAQFASSATNATNAVSAVFATSATNATNAVSAVFASSATNATTAITVNYGGVVQTSTANIGDVSASSLFVYGNVSADGTLDVGGQVSVGGGIKVIGNLSASNIHAGGTIYGDGSGLFNLPSGQGGTVKSVKAGTGIHTTFNGTTTTNPITTSGTMALNANQSFGIVSATSFVLAGLGALITDTSATALVTALSATMATSIDNSNTNITSLSATMATSIDNSNTNITANTNAITALSATMATSIGNSNTNITTNTNAITSINAVLGDGTGFATDAELAALSATMATSIGSTNTNVTTNINAITSINSILGDGSGFATDAELAALSATMATSIGNSNTNITANINAITSINSILGDGSGFATDSELAALSATMATSIGNSNTLIAATSAALATSIGNSNTNITTNTNAITSINAVIGGSGFATGAQLAALSATLATSIGNSNTLIAATSAALATSIGNTNTNVTTNINAITSINSILGDGTGFATDAELAAVSVALATSIGNTNSNVTTNINAITSINSILGDGTGFATDAELAAVSATLATSINNSNTNITTNTNAITSINSVIGDGSGFATDAELAAVSATLATSISNQMPKSGGTFTGNVSHGDNVKAQFGASNDLQIYHNGTNSIIADAGAGNLYLAGSTVGMTNAAGTNYTIKSVDGGAVELYYNTAIKIQTTNTGVHVTGDVNFNDGGKATFGGGSDLQIYHDGSNSYITDSGTGDLVINTNGNAISLNPNGGGEYGLRVINNGAVNLYHDNSLKLATTSTGVEVSDSSTQGLVKLGQIHMKNSSGSFVSGSDGVIHLPYTDGHYYVDNYDGGILFRTTSYQGLLSLFSTGLYAYRNTIGSVVTAAVSGNVTPDLATYNSFVLTLTGNITLINPSTEAAGMSGVFIFIHSGAARTVSLGTDYETAGGAGLTLSGAAGAVDMVPYYVQATGNILLGTPMLAFS